MLSKSDVSISDTLSAFAASGIEVCLIVPTATGMDKSIMDATDQVRVYLKSHGFHDYLNQLQGPQNKVTKPAYFVFPNHLQNTQVSLYRPTTKSGDPRIWFYKLNEYANPYNLLALFVNKHSLFIVNCSNQAIVNSVSKSSTPLGEVAYSAKAEKSSAAIELLDKLKYVSSLGYIPTVTSGDTGIGMTLEHHLGIIANTSRGPDYKGIEIKSKRLGKKLVPKNRVTLFSQVPNWKLSPIGSAWNLLSQYGYLGKGGKLRLSHQIDTIKPNSIGLVLQLDSKNRWLKQNHQTTDDSSIVHLTTWELDKLRERLTEKHRETFWVNALSNGIRRDESFHYIEVQHTKAPMTSNFESLLEAGLISVDYTMSARDESKKTVRDHGYLFKIHPVDIPALFPNPVTYKLTE